MAARQAAAGMTPGPSPSSYQPPPPSSQLYPPQHQQQQQQQQQQQTPETSKAVIEVLLQCLRTAMCALTVIALDAAKTANPE